MDCMYNFWNIFRCSCRLSRVPQALLFPFVLHLDYTQRRSFPAFEDIQLVAPD